MPMNERVPYLQVFLTFVRNSLIRDMMFRSNFLLECIASLSWTLMNLGFYVLIFFHLPNKQMAGWGQYEFFIFIATTWMANSIVQAFFMPNAQQLSELIRTGGLDFALLKPIDTQFLVSLQRIDWSALANTLAGFLLIGYSVVQLRAADPPLEVSAVTVALYVFYLFCGVAILYSVMISLAATSIWLGRNQTLYDFWFYITNFARYPMEIYDGRWGTPLRHLFTFLIPVLIVVNVPARALAQPLRPASSLDGLLAGFAILATIGSLAGSRWLFKLALLAYRSASS